jgi:head-tail adaptor
MINFGQYTERLKFRTFQNVPDGYGGFVPIFVDILTTNARIVQVGKARDLESLQITLPKTYTVGVQVRSGFEPNETMMIDYKGYLHNITGIQLNDERMRPEWVISMVRGGDKSPDYNGILNTELNAEL